MEKITRYISQRYGKDLSVFNPEFLLQTIAMRMEANHMKRLEVYYQHLQENEKEVFDLFSSLFVCYSEFFREPLSWYLLEKQVIPEIISRKKNGQVIRVWSVGCAEGQEPYSFSMLAEETLKLGEKDIRLRIFATDMVEEALEKSRKGIYKESALKNMSLHRIEKYFSRQADDYVIKEHLKNSVTFLKYDIMDAMTTNPPESIYGGFDLILCRNLLIYYHLDSQKFILDKLSKALAPGGYIVTGESEMLVAENMGKLVPLKVTGAVFKMIRHLSKEAQ